MPSTPAPTLPKIYPILDTAALAAKAISIESAAQAMLAGGARILQVRHKGHWSRTFFGEVERVRKQCCDQEVLFIVDDRADFALLLDAGLHVGQDDLPALDARSLIGADRVLGLSTHNAEQLAAAAGQPVDYIAVGPIFGTTSKNNFSPAVGLDNLRQWRSLTKRPLVAIGGITRENALSVFDAGADSVAIIGDLLPDVVTLESLRQRMEEWQRLVAT